MCNHNISFHFQKNFFIGHLGGPRFNPSFPWLGTFFTFAAVFNLMQLSNAHTKCMETLTLNTLDTRHTAFVGAFVGTWY